MIVVTGATGKLGSLVVEALLEKVPAKEIAVAVRNPQKAAAFAARGVEVRTADYAKPETLAAAFAGAEKLLLISSSEVGQRAPQHLAVIAAAKKAGVKFIAYTSILHADTSKMVLAAEHKATEAALRDSGVPYAILRNGWYSENYTEHLAAALAQGALIGSAGQGRIAAATRADYAAAAVAVLTGHGHENKVYELAGDAPFTMSDLAVSSRIRRARPLRITICPLRCTPTSSSARACPSPTRRFSSMPMSTQPGVHSMTRPARSVGSSGARRRRSAKQ